MEVKKTRWCENSAENVAREIGVSLLALLFALGATALAAEEGHHVETGATTEQAEFSGKLVDGVRVVNVEAFKYDFEPDPIVVGLGEKVRLELKSRDVTHGLGIKEYGIDEVVPVGGKATVSFMADKAGTFHIHCTVFCGPGHGDMHGTLIVKAPE